MERGTVVAGIVTLVLGGVLGAGLRDDAGAQIPGLPGSPSPGTTSTTPAETGTDTTGTTATTPPPPPPPVVDPGPLGDSTTHLRADAARRGAVAAAGLQPPLRSLWRQDFDGLVSSAVAGDGRVYLNQGTAIIALDLRTGQRLWTAPVGSAWNGMAFGAGKLVVGLAGGIVALDAGTGAVMWSVSDKGGLIGGAVLIAGDLVVAQHQGLVAYDLATGARRWRGGTTDGVDGAPAAAGDRIYQFGGCTLAAVDRRGGHGIWSRNSGCTGGTSGTVAVQGDRVHSSFAGVPVAAADGGEVLGQPTVDIAAGDVGLARTEKGIAAYRLSTGAPLWQAAADKSQINDTLGAPLGAPLVVGSTLFQTRFEGTVEARDLTSGAVTWRGKLRTAKETFTGSSSASDFALAAGSGVLVVLRGSTVDGLSTATEPARSLAITTPKLANRLVEAGTERTVRGAAAGDLLPVVQLEVDPYPFDRFIPAGAALAPRDPGALSLKFTPDRNVRVRLAGVAGSTVPTPSYTLFAYPRIRIDVRNHRNRVRAALSVSGSGDLRFRGRRVHLYVVRAKQHRMTRLGSAKLTGPRRGRGRGVIRFRALRRVGKRDSLFACVPQVHRLGQGAGDPVQRRCGRRSIRF